MASVFAGNTTVTGNVNNSTGYAAGATTMTVNNLSAAISVGTWFTVAGDDSPQQVVSTVGGATPTSITMFPGLRKAVVNGAAITIYSPGLVNNVGNYAAGWSKEITVDGFTVAPQVGQLVSFGNGDPSVAGYSTYSIIDVDGTTGITLDRPLDVGINDEDDVNIGPSGQFNLAFHRNAIALVVRPLAMPKPGTGALSAVVNHNDLSMRATITYDGNKQGHLVTLDMLCGISILDFHLGAVMLG